MGIGEISVGIESDWASKSDVSLPSNVSEADKYGRRAKGSKDIVWSIKLTKWDMFTLGELSMETRELIKFNFAATTLLSLGFGPEVHVLVASNNLVKSVVLTQFKLEYRFSKKGDFFSRNLK